MTLHTFQRGAAIAANYFASIISLLLVAFLADHASVGDVQGELCLFVIEVLQFPLRGYVTGGAVLIPAPLSELAAVIVLGCVAPAALFRGLGKLRGGSHVAIGTLDFYVASIEREVRYGVIESAQDLPLLRHVTGFARQSYLVRIGMTRVTSL